ncbi:MAG: CDP-diacylglycerol--glycerol-3-phosphate 3-phosphatidyltransferase [Planctomycetes bacterium]|nr:CDP-diacylglycerol--glycerol-3-phosphate 3-phosphatidyltransferase [Planctomycetota bacterium]
MKILNLPNQITLSRLALSAATFVLLALAGRDRVEIEGTTGWICVGLFVLSSATDWLDGYLARRLHLVTPFGRIMDPFVDKVSVCGTFVFLAVLDPASTPAWIVVTIVGREFFVQSIRSYLESRNVSFAAELPGKVKFVLQCCAIGAILVQHAWAAAAPSWWEWFARILLWLALLSTVHSGWFYMRKALAHLRDAEC